MKIRKLFEEVEWMILEEGTNYAEMFSSIDRQINVIADEYRQQFGPDSEFASDMIAYFEERKHSMIKNIKAFSDRQDVRIWLTRIAKIYLLKRMTAYMNSVLQDFGRNYTDDTNGDDEWRNLIKMAGDLFDEKTDLETKFLGASTNAVGSFEHLLLALQHFFSLPIPEIQEFEFRKEHTYQYVWDLFAEYEQEWQETIGEKDSRLVPFKGHKIIDFGDGYAWWDLEDTWCPEEGKAAGHCGNSPYKDDPNQKAYSLRKEVYKGVYEPALFFVYHIKEKGLGERKGVGNSKPHSKYHKYIEALIMEPFIERFLEGRSYMADNDFQITDLSNWKQIFEQKPDLLPLRQYIKEIGFDDYIQSKFEFESRYSTETVIDSGTDIHLVYNMAKMKDTFPNSSANIARGLANLLIYGDREDRKGFPELDLMQDTVYHLGKELFPNVNPFKWDELFKVANDFYNPRSSAVRIADQIRDTCSVAFQDLLIEALKNPAAVTGFAEVFIKEMSYNGNGYSLNRASSFFHTIAWDGYKSSSDDIGITIPKAKIFDDIDPYTLTDDYKLVLDVKEIRIIPQGSYSAEVMLWQAPYTDPGDLKLDISREFDEFVFETNAVDVILNQRMTAPFFSPYLVTIKNHLMELFSEYEYIAPEPFLR